MTTIKPAMEHKTAHLAFMPKRETLPAWWEVARMNPGVARRQLMMQLLLRSRSNGDTYHGVRVNDKHVLPSSDSDLQILVRRGMLLRRRVSGGGRKRNTELYLAPNVAA